MKTDEYDYNLDERLIAQSPCNKRGESKLLVLDKSTGEIEHKKFGDVLDYLNKGDALVINDTKVMPARIIGIKEETGAVIELLILKNIKDDLFEVLAKPQKRLKVGTIVSFGEGKLKVKVCEIKDGMVVVKLIYGGILMEVLESLGSMPLPPYITKTLEDKERYQTVYAKNYGSSAAPTAGLHFTKELLKKAEDKGVKIVTVTLHVGLGTFKPVDAVNIKEHKMHSEYYEINKASSDILNKVKETGGKIIAVGTTSVRTLESAISSDGLFYPIKEETNIFIYPGYKFKAVDKIITNFHLPKSTLLMLVSAFSSKEYIKKAYSEAIEKEYSFFSFGDAMIIK